jgi:hypothetical protein
MGASHVGSNPTLSANFYCKPLCCKAFGSVLFPLSRLFPAFRFDSNF